MGKWTDHGRLFLPSCLGRTIDCDGSIFLPLESCCLTFFRASRRPDSRFTERRMAYGRRGLYEKRKEKEIRASLFRDVAISRGAFAIFPRVFPEHLALGTAIIELGIWLFTPCSSKIFRPSSATFGRGTRRGQNDNVDGRRSFRSRDQTLLAVDGDYRVSSKNSLVLLQARTHTKTTRQEMEGRLPFWRNQDTAPRPSHTVSVCLSPCLFVCLFQRLYVRPSVRPSVRRYVMAKLSSPVRKIDGSTDWRDRRFSVNTCKK